MKEFNPKTGAYWQGWEDALDGKPEDPPEGYSEASIEDYKEGYAALLADLERLPRQPHEMRAED